MMLTVFTPTFNRAYTLPRLYESLTKQSSKNFCWLIVDDGSSDGTKELIQSYISEEKIDIKYYRQENAGKHVAHNLGVSLCETELFVCVDSDDWLTDNAVETIINKSTSENNILGAYFRRVFPNGNNIASEYPNGVKLVGIEDLYHKYGFCGDTVIVLKTALIKDIKFPVFENEKFVTERIWYNMLNDIAPMLLCEEGIYFCEYLPDGYSKNIEKVMASNPYGTVLDYLSESAYGDSVIYRIKHYAYFCFYLKKFNLNINVFEDFKQPTNFVKLVGRLFAFDSLFKILTGLTKKLNSIYSIINRVSL